MQDMKVFPDIVVQWLQFPVRFLIYYWYEKEGFVAVCHLVVVLDYCCVVETDGKKIVVVVVDMMTVVVVFGQMVDMADGEDYDRNSVLLGCVIICGIC